MKRIPEALTSCRQWVCWRTEGRKGKPTKVPINPRTGDRASCSDDTTWGTFEEALQHFRSEGFEGVGYVFRAGDPFAGIDLDECRSPQTGAIELWAIEIVNKLNSYAEISPSGTGIHVFVRAKLPPGRRRQGHLEMYDRARYFTVTGDHLEGTPETIEERGPELRELHAQIFGASRTSDNGSSPRGRSTFFPDDAELIRRAGNAANGAKFTSLWRGDWTGYQSQSEADLALCGMLGFWTTLDGARVDRLFRQSGLFRPKWDERHGSDGRTYGQITITKASKLTSEAWTPSSDDLSVGADRLPSIVVSNRQLRDITGDALKALVAANAPPRLFVRAGQLVRVRCDEEGRPIIDILRESELRARLASVCNSIRLSSARGGEVQTDCFPPLEVVQNILALGEWPFPPLQAIVELPILRPDSTILGRPGYDAETRLVYAPAPGLELPEIPSQPTSRDVATALELIEEVIGEFPYLDQASKANTLASMMTPMVRFAIRGKAPLALFDAPQPGTGKSLLADVLGLVATGRAAAMMAAPREEEEWRKRITAVLASGATVITIDNVEHRLESASLAIALTAREWTDRILGHSKTITLPLRASWIATGNNIRLGGDLPRRCYWIRLDAQSSRPWKRTGFKHPELLAWVSENRGEFIRALLILARAWFAAGKPQAEVPTVGGFDEWAKTVGGILRYVGAKGFLGNLEALYELADEATTQWEAFLLALAAAFGDEPFTVRELADRLATDERLREALPDQVAGLVDKGDDFRRRIGQAFSKRVETRYGDAEIRLVMAGELRHAVRWRVLSG